MVKDTNYDLSQFRFVTPKYCVALNCFERPSDYLLFEFNDKGCTWDSLISVKLIVDETREVITPLNECNAMYKTIHQLYLEHENEFNQAFLD